MGTPAAMRLFMRRHQRQNQRGVTTFELLVTSAGLLVMGFGVFRVLDSGVKESALCIADQVRTLSRTGCAARTSAGLPPPSASAENLEKIREQLDGNLFGNVTTGQLREIIRQLEQMSPEERDAVIAGLSDEELGAWMDELGGAWGGLSGEEKRRLYGLLAEGLDGDQLARVARAVFAEAPESEHEFIDSVVAHADAATQRELIAASMDDINSDPHEDFDVSLGSTEWTKTYGNAQTRMVARVLASLGADGSTQADFDAAVADLAAAGKLDEVLLIATGRVDGTGAVAIGSPGIIRSSFAPGPLIGIIDGAARSDDPEVRRQVLVASSHALEAVEFSDEFLQKAGFEDRPETPRILSSLYGLLQVPPPKPEWTPPDNVESDYTDDPRVMLDRLRAQNPRVQEAADHYGVDPRAIALVAQVEAKYNNDLARQAGLGRGEGFGQMHHSAARAIHPEWTAEQSEAARNNAAYAAPLIAADLDAKARAFELVTGGQISIRNDPVTLAWAYNNSLATVTAEAEKARQALDRGEPVVIDLKQGSELGEYGMAGHARRDLEAGAVDDFASSHPPAGSPVEYRTETL
jgi:hypothetical protein